MPRVPTSAPGAEESPARAPKSPPKPKAGPRAKAAKKPDARAERKKALGEAADRWGSYRPARAVFEPITAVPTIFCQTDHALRIGGWPIKRTGIIHGKSNEGKSSRVLGLIRSFLLRGHRALHVDAERTTPIDWVDAMVGADLVDSGRYFAHKPESYEDTMALVRKFAGSMRDERASVDPNAAAIVVVDSLKRLIPRDAMAIIAADMNAFAEDVEKAKKRGARITGGRDRLGQVIAKMTAAWMQEMTVLTDVGGIAFVAVAREYKNPDAEKWEKEIGWDFIIGGGGDSIFEASVCERIERKWVQQSDEEKASEDRPAVVFGERHRAVCWKTKVAGKDAKKVVSFFHTSNGNLIPAGWDPSRDVLELGERLGVVERRNGGWFSFDGKTLGQGANRVVPILHADPQLRGAIEARCRALFASAAPVEFDPGTGEVFDQ